jgi:hypothetical protein
MPKRRKWGKACESIDFPPPIGFCTSRPLIRSVILVRDGQGWSLSIHTSVTSTEEHRRLDQRFQMVVMLAARRAPHLTLRRTDASELSSAQVVFGALVAGDLLTVPVNQPLEPASLLEAAPTPVSRTLALTVGESTALARLVPGLSLASPERFAAAMAADARLLDLTCELEQEPSLVELQLASRIVRQAARTRWRAAESRIRATLLPQMRRHLLASTVLPSYRDRLEAIALETPPTEVQRDGAWHCELGGVPLMSAKTLDALRAKMLSESPKLGSSQPEWRRARQMLESPSTQTLFVLEPGFLKHLVLTVGGTGRLRARRMTADRCVHHAVALLARGRRFDINARPGADPRLVSKLSQISKVHEKANETFGVERNGRLILANRGNVRNIPLTLALSRPRQMTYLPERAEWLPGLRPPRDIGERATVHATVDALDASTARALFVDHHGRLYSEVFSSAQLEWWVLDIRTLLDESNTSLSLAVAPPLASMQRRRPPASSEPVELLVKVAGPRVTVALGDETFGGNEPLGFRALAEAVFSRWPVGARGHVRIAHIEGLDTLVSRQGTDHTALERLALRSRVLRRLSAHLASISRLLEAA